MKSKTENQLKFQQYSERWHSKNRLITKLHFHITEWSESITVKCTDKVRDNGTVVERAGNTNPNNDSTN